MAISTYEEITLRYGHEHFDEGTKGIIKSRITIQTKHSEIDVSAAQRCLKRKQADA